jgi:hypothetical protein
METQQQSISTRKKWNIKHGRTASRKWELPKSGHKTKKWALHNPAATFIATHRATQTVEHDHQTPENSEPVKRREIRPNEPTAFCHNCQEMTPMVWLPKEERGKNCDTWFKCEFCGGRHLTIKYITEKEAVAKNKLAKEAEDL